MLDIKGTESLNKVVITTREAILSELFTTLMFHTTEKHEEHIVSFKQVGTLEGENICLLGTGGSGGNHGVFHQRTHVGDESALDLLDVLDKLTGGIELHEVVKDLGRIRNFHGLVVKSGECGMRVHLDTDSFLFRLFNARVYRRLEL